MTGKKLLDEVMIAAPCSVGWDSMKGDDRVRFCDKSELNVYNLSGMSDTEAEALLQNSQSNICVSLYRRADGTVITDNCPIGLRKLRDNLVKARERGNLLAKVAAGAALFLLGLPAGADDKKTSVPLAGTPCPPTAKDKNQGQPNEIPMRTGGIVAPPIKPTTTPPKEIQAKGEADITAFKYYTEARKNQLNGNLMQAEICYMKALEAVPKDKHDPKFRAKIRKEYAKFLKDQHRDREANELPQ
jgi:hypothetical protein